MAIIYVLYEQIDKVKWDDCIDKAANGLLYARSTYLDCMAEQWDALVLDDYKAVMPLTWRKKYGISYLYQPYFTACLGVFGQEIDAVLLNGFLQHIPAKFKYFDIYLNHGNFFQLKDFQLYERMNFVLALQEPYEKLFTHFRDNIKRNIKKAEKLNCIVKKDFRVEDVIELATAQSRDFANLDEHDFKKFKKLYHLLHIKEQAVTYGIFSSTDELLASCVLFISQQRLYYILVGNHPNGKTIGASHALINAIIKDYAGKNCVLDFEGSDIPSLAFFYSSFGAAEEKYPGLRHNRLPRLLRFLKK